MNYTSDKEGSLEAPVRHPVKWREKNFYDKESLNQELERVFDICHTCRRCVSLCNAFPTLFDLVDESSTMEVDGVPKESFSSVVDQCYLCDLCYLTKCPYVPPHEWKVDFPHLMLRAKAVSFEEGKAKIRDKILTSTITVGKLAGLPVVSEVVNKVSDNRFARTLLEKIGGIHAKAPLPKFERSTFRKKYVESNDFEKKAGDVQSVASSGLKVALFVTCYGDYNSPSLVRDMQDVFRLSGINLKVIQSDSCCGMPKFELGDLQSVEKFNKENIGEMVKLAKEGYFITAPIPSCVLMYRKELPLLIPEDHSVKSVADAMLDPFELLMMLHSRGTLNTNFVESLGTVAYHAPCHQRVQNIGFKTKEVLELVPGTSVNVVEKCSGHNGTYAVKKESYPFAKKICRPVIRSINEKNPDFYISDCPMAFDLIEQGMESMSSFKSGFAALKFAYGITV